MLYRVFVFPQFRWALGFWFSFLPGFWGKSSCSTISFLFLFSLGTFFLFSDSSAYWGSLQKSLSCIWEWIGKKVTGFGWNRFDFCYFEIPFLFFVSFCWSLIGWFG